MIDHHVPSLTSIRVRRVTLACRAVFRGVAQPANEYRLVFLLVFLPATTIFERLQIFTYCAPVVVIGVVGPSRIGRPAGTVPAEMVGGNLRNPRVGDQCSGIRT